MFVVSVAATAWFCRTMSDGMAMPGGWTMSMMWMRMPGQSWAASGLMFMAMWAAMMTAMMLPSSLPMVVTFHRARTNDGRPRPTVAALIMFGAYALVWCVVGVGVYVAGVALAELAMRSDSVGRLMPVVFAGGILLAGIWQFLYPTRRALGCCRTLETCGPSTSAFGYGLERGVQCVTCCAGLMLAMLAIGMMNPLVMIATAGVIAVAKLLPRPQLTLPITGVALLIVGAVEILRAAWPTR
jgi:predicted metal-binding membrane protein